MSRSIKSPFSFGRSIKTWATVFIACMGMSSLLHARGPKVTYDPEQRIVEYPLPVDYSYDLKVTAPDGYIVGPLLPLIFRVQVTEKPATAQESDARAYLTFSPSAIALPLGQKETTVTVRLRIPVTATPGKYGYQIFTDGWPLDLNFTDPGTSINVSATAVSAPPPPSVSIQAPEDQAVFSYSASEMPARIPFTINASATAAYPITNIVADLNGVSITPTTTTGMNTATASIGGNLTIGAPGQYSITAKAFNQVGDATDVNQFTVNVNAAPPTVTIDSPTPSSTYNYRAGGAAVAVPFKFTAKSSFGGIRTLTAKIDNVDVTNQFTPTGLGTLTASGQINLSYTTAGTHTLQVTTTDDYGTATADSNFVVTVTTPTPVVTITAPTNGSSFNVPSGATSMSIPFSFGTVTTAGFTVDSVSATLDGNPVTIATNSPSVLGTAASVTSSGNLANVGPGTHTLIATGTSAGVVDTDSVTFTVVASSVTPPSVAITAPAVNSTYTLVVPSSGGSGASVTVPLTFVGTSNMTNGVITKLTATIDGKTVTVGSTTLNQKVATGTASLVVTSAGTHTIGVTATDAVGTASATRTFKVVVVYAKNICGRVFFDLNFNGVFDQDCDDRRCSGSDWNDCRGSRYDRYSDRGDCRDSGDRYYSRDNDDDNDSEDFGLGGITVKLVSSSGAVVATQVTDSSGNYSFANVAPGSYTVSVVVPSGYGATTLSSRAVSVSTSNVVVRDIGLGLKFSDIDNLCANGRTSDYWKSQIDKCIKGDRNADVSNTTCNSHTKTIGSLALSVYDGLTNKNASSTLGSGSSSSRDQLSKQLLAAEYNYANGAYINGNKTLTYCFIQWGERVHKNSSKYSSSYCNNARDWFKAYNGSQGGRVNGPQ